MSNVNKHVMIVLRLEVMDGVTDDQLKEAIRNEYNHEGYFEADDGQVIACHGITNMIAVLTEVEGQTMEIKMGEGT